MAEFKLVLGLKDGKSVQRVLQEPDSNTLVGMKIGDKLKGDKVGMAGYEFEISGGSDNCGFPMRKDLTGSGRKKVLITRGKGMRKKGKGLRKRVTVCGNTIHDQISQVNLKVVKVGKAKLEPKSEEEKEADKKQEKPKKDAKEKKAPQKKEEKKPKEEK
jgi:small subunit ribosomal protein S6e